MLIPVSVRIIRRFRLLRLLVSMDAGHSPEAIFNQSPPLEGYNLFDSDSALKEAVHREGGGWIEPEARKLGELCGRPDTINLGVLANRFAP